MQGLIADVFFGESSTIAEGVQNVRIVEGEYEHERAVVTVAETVRTSKRFVSGSPVSIQWGRPPGATSWFIGYVNHTEPIHSPLGSDRQGSTGPLMSVVCVGVTWVAKDQRTRTYRQAAPAYVVRQIAKEMRLDTSRVATSGRPEAVLHQHGQSDWEFMVHCAKKAGLVMFTRGTALFCEDRRILITQASTSALLLTSAVAGGSVREFVPSRGAAAPSGGEAAVRMATMLNLRSGAVASSTVRGPDRPLFTGATTQPVRSVAKTRTPFTSIGDARDHMAAEAAVNSLSITARLVASVDPRCRVGKVIVVAGFGADSDGLWYITNAEHEISGGRNEMTLRLGRDTEAPYVGAKIAGLSSKPAARGARLLGGYRWVAA